MESNRLKEKEKETKKVETFPSSNRWRKLKAKEKYCSERSMETHGSRAPPTKCLLFPLKIDHLCTRQGPNSLNLITPNDNKPFFFFFF